MKAKRQMKIRTNEFIVGDQIKIKLNGLGKFTATAHRVYGDGTVEFIFDHCVARKQMNEESTNEGGFLNSDLNKWMNTELLEAFPEKLRNRMEIVGPGGSKLTLPTYGEMFGHDDFYEEFEKDQDDQLELMKDRKNRVCDCDGEYTWYWIKNARVYASANFAIVSYNGYASYNGASDSLGVRPVFMIKNR